MTYIILLDGPFRFCLNRRGAKIERLYAAIFDLPDGPLRDRRFDLAMLGDILIHTIDPLTALASAATLCQGTLLIAQPLYNTADALFHRRGSTRSRRHGMVARKSALV